MTTKSSGEKARVPLDIRPWLYDPASDALIDFVNRDDAAAAYANWSEYERLKKKRGNLTACLLFSTLLCALIMFAFFAVKEKDKIRGISLAFHNKSFPSGLPDGMLQLRSVDKEYRNREHGMKWFNPFIASTQKKGEISIMTNLTNPHFHAFTVKHPEIEDVTMITDELFCSTATCFYIGDAYATINFDILGKLPDLSSNVIKVPLPVGMSFEKAQHCPGLKGCRILLRTSEGEQHFAVVVQEELSDIPYIQSAGPIREHSYLITKEMEVRAFRNNSRYEHIVVWFDGQLGVIYHDDHDNEQHMAIVTDADADEVVEIQKIGPSMLGMLVMKEDIEAGRTSVRFFGIGDRAVTMRHDELTIFNRPSAISIFKWNDTFEICELPQGASHLKCYSNILPN